MVTTEKLVAFHRVFFFTDKVLYLFRHEGKALRDVKAFRS